MNTIWGVGVDGRREKWTGSCVKFDSFSSQGFELTYFSFSSCRFPSFGEKFWLSGWKKLNGAETTLFDVLSSWIEEKKEVERVPQPHSNVSYETFPLAHLQASDSWFTFLPDRFKLNCEPTFPCFSLPWRPTPWAQARPGKAETVCKGRARPPRKTCLPPNVTLLTFLKSPLGPGVVISRKSCFESNLYNLLSLWSWVGWSPNSRCKH